MPFHTPGNAGGMWDQNKIDNDAGGNPVPDGSVVEYDLLTASPALPARGLR